MRQRWRYWASAAVIAVTLSALPALPGLHSEGRGIDPPSSGLIEWIKLLLGALAVLAGGAGAGYMAARRVHGDRRDDRTEAAIDQALDSIMRANAARVAEAQAETADARRTIDRLRAERDAAYAAAHRAHGEAVALRAQLARLRDEIPPPEAGPPTVPMEIGRGRSQP